MRAFALTRFGASPTLTDASVPDPEEGEIRVRVRAASVNGFDLAVMSGYARDYFDHYFPVVIGKDFAGEVDAVAPDVTGFARGDRVFGVVTKAFLREGSYAEYLTQPVDVGVARLPDSVSFTEGAALGMAGTAARRVLDASRLRPDETAFVVGAPGGVGTQVVQLAKTAGARVIATAATAEERAHVARLGADEIVDPADLTERARELTPAGADVVFHLAGDPSVAGVLRDGGRFVSLLLNRPDDVPSGTAVVLPVYADPTPETLERIAADHASGATRLTVQEVFPLDRVEEALETFGRGTIGKVVIGID